MTRRPSTKKLPPLPLPTEEELALIAMRKANAQYEMQWFDDLPDKVKDVLRAHGGNSNQCTMWLTANGYSEEQIVYIMNQAAKRFHEEVMKETIGVGSSILRELAASKTRKKG